MVGFRKIPRSSYAEYEISLSEVYLYPVEGTEKYDCSDIDFPCWKKRERVRVTLKAFEWKRLKRKWNEKLKKVDFNSCAFLFEQLGFEPKVVERNSILFTKKGNGKETIGQVYGLFSLCPVELEGLTERDGKFSLEVKLVDWSKKNGRKKIGRRSR